MSSDGSTVIFRRAPAGVRAKPIQDFARQLEREVAKGRTFDCLITGDRELRLLNLRFRGRDEATDVLSFPAETAEAAPSRGTLRARRGIRRASRTEPRALASGARAGSLGDIAISLARARAPGDAGSGTAPRMKSASSCCTGCCT